MYDAFMKYRDSTLPIEERIHDLLHRMNLKEKARQMDMFSGDLFIDKISAEARTHRYQNADFSPEKMAEVIGEQGIGCIHDFFPLHFTVVNRLQKYSVENTRLGIPILISEEALHGCSIPGSTSFPQAISMAATWNPDLVQKIGEATASEVRSKGIHLVFAPVLGIAREPRWGRTEETYGEDTYLASRMGVAMCRGMQGNTLASDHSIVAEPKHFGGHSMPYGGLNTNQFAVGERDLRKDFLSVFEKAVIEAGAMSVMCAYHANDAVPCAADSWLMKGVLRDEWGFKGFVCSDLEAIRRLEFIHHTADSAEDAIAQSVEAGMDMQFYDYEHDVWTDSIMSAVEKGTLSIEAVDRAVSGILRVKFMLGLFENPYIDETVSSRVTRCESHIATSLQTARESMCLLKN